MTQNKQELLTAWRKAEDRFYSSVMNAPELYTAGIRLVRAIANDLQDVTAVADLFDAYPNMTISRVATIADSLALIQRDFLDYNLARDAAFYLRHREILEEQAQTEILTQLEAARAQGEAWVTLYNNETPGQSITFFQRLEMHLSDGIGLYSALELDWEKGRVYVIEPIYLDPATGLPTRQLAPPGPRQEFTNREEFMVTLAALRAKYSTQS
jgi:hypothetical protein